VVVDLCVKLKYVPTRLQSLVHSAKFVFPLQIQNHIARRFALLLFWRNQTSEGGILGVCKIPKPTLSNVVDSGLIGAGKNYWESSF
jgi:hypothetical protein